MKMSKYYKRKKQGRCPRCNTIVLDNHVNCPDCRKHFAQVERDRRKNPLFYNTRLYKPCEMCGTLIKKERGRKFCKKCVRQRDRAYRQKAYQERIK